MVFMSNYSVVFETPLQVRIQLIQESAIQDCPFSSRLFLMKIGHDLVIMNFISKHARGHFEYLIDKQQLFLLGSIQVGASPFPSIELMSQFSVCRSDCVGQGVKSFNAESISASVNLGNLYFSNDSSAQWNKSVGVRLSRRLLC